MQNVINNYKKFVLSGFHDNHESSIYANSIHNIFVENENRRGYCKCAKM